jgi:hypothetical protein
MALAPKGKENNKNLSVKPVESNIVEKKEVSDLTQEKGNVVKVTNTAVKLVEIIFKKEEKRNISVKVQIMEKSPDEPLPIITKENGEYSLNSLNEICKKLFLKKDDDPKIKSCKEFGVVQKKITKEERMEEETCHGDVMGQIDNAIDGDMLSGDK